MPPPPPPPLPPPSDAVAKALTRLMSALAEGAAYEGQQIAKTVAARLRARGGDGGAADAVDLLERGAEAQLGAGQVWEGSRQQGSTGVCGVWRARPATKEQGIKKKKKKKNAGGWLPLSKKKPAASSILHLPPHPPTPPALLSFTHQITCGSELASMVLDGLDPADFDGGAARVLRLLAAFGAAPPAAQAPSCEEAIRFAASALKWARTAAGSSPNAPAKMAAMHGAAAAAVGAAAAGATGGGPLAALAAAAPLWARARDPAGFAAAVSSAAAAAPPADRGAIAARAVLQTLAAGGPDGSDPAGAAEDAAALARALERVAAPADPLASFPALIAEAAARGSPALAALAVREYGPALARDPSGGLAGLAGEAAAACGRVSCGGGGGGGMGGLADLMRMLGG